MEVLAPVGGREQLTAAVFSGADAVYLGTGNFNARRRADSFGGGSLKEAVAWCHGRGVRVHVTVNTLVRDRELPSLFDTVKEVAEAGADAVILQDLAAAAFFRDHVPALPRHASTQMSVHNVRGALLAQELGFSRVILARELSLEEIRRIREAVDIELEVFVHGALCMGFSGQCLLSAMLGERSGNRGYCAQPCRLDFRAGERDHALSLKDACLIPHIRELEEAGVSSLKIEGRLRRPEYVAAAVDACRKALAGEKPDLERLERVFSRSGFTDGYLTGRRDLRMFGRRTEADKSESAGVLRELSGLYRRELSRVPVDMALTLRPGEPVRLTVTDGRFEAAAEGEPPEPVRSAAPDFAAQLGRTGGTPFYLRSLKEDAEPGWTARLNPLRREALARLLAARETAEPWPVAGAPELPGPRKKSSQPKLRLRFEKKEQFFELPEAEAYYLPVEVLDAETVERLGEKLIAELPRLLFPRAEAALAERLRALRALGLRTVCAGNPGTLRLARELGFRISGGFDLNILNGRALREWEALGAAETLLSPELYLPAADSLGEGIPRGIIAYGHLPLMLFRCCPMQGEAGCGSCPGCRFLGDRHGVEFPVLCHRKQYSTLLNPVPLYVGDRDLRPVDYLVAYFTLEEREECRRIAALLSERAPFGGERTLGPYFRKLL
ncbi:MAG: U32 family peptidase [Oscillospiraceae bacterium]|nr:U32 family peptidase [Oscillospiraceae bacterium]